MTVSMNSVSEISARQVALNARIDLAMYRLLRELDPERAEQHLELATELAYEAGFGWPEDAAPSAFVIDERELLAPFEAGRQDAAIAMGMSSTYAAWMGDWRMEYDGQTETRDLVMREEDGKFYPCVETSWRGGEGPIDYVGDGFATLEQALAFIRSGSTVQADV